MKTPILSLFLAAALEPLAMPPLAAATHASVNELRPGTVLIVAASPSGPQAGATGRILDELTRALGPSQPVQVLRFDAEPGVQNEQTIQGTNQDLVVIEPRTPMKDAIEMALLQLITIPTPRNLIIVAHDQIYPSSLSTDSLWEFARQSEIHVYTIHVASTDKQTRVRRFGRRLRNGISGAFKRGPEQQGHSARDTRRFMRFMADATGGQACVANDENTGIPAARAIASQILNPPSPELQSASESECLSWGADLPRN